LPPQNFESIAKEYLGILHREYEHAILSGEYTPELSFRPAIDNYFRVLSTHLNSHVRQIFEPKRQGNTGHPDWRFHDSKSMGVFGYAEAKALDPLHTISISTHIDQIRKYLHIGNKVILTDGIDFVFFTPSTEYYKYLSLIQKPIRSKQWHKLSINPALEQEFREFFKEAGSRRVTEEELVRAVAARASQMSLAIKDLTELPVGAGFDSRENRTIAALLELKKILETEHDPALSTAKAFSDFVAQVLAFGLLYAHRVIAGRKYSPTDRYSNIQRFWTDAVYREYSERLRPFRALLQLLGDELNASGTIGSWYDDCRLFLAHIELKEEQKHIPDYHILYEKFLTEFDPQTRFDYGAYYTPQPLAYYAVRLSEAISKCSFGDLSLYGEHNKLIDPCCGTGTFLEQLVVNSPGNTPEASIIGFEILPAPYALAHYRLKMLGTKSLRVSLVLTNTLSDELEGDKKRAPSNLIEEEQSAARLLAKPPLTLVIGNPPSSDSSPHTEGSSFTIIHRLMEDYRPPIKARRDRQNIQKQIQNPFLWFIRWSCNKLLQSENGILVMVVPSSFCEHESYAYARRWLTSMFYKIWVMDIDLDSRTGVRTSSLFNVQQGRSLIAAVRKSRGAKYECQKIIYRSIAHLSKLEKIDELSRKKANSDYLCDYQPIKIDNRTYSFRTSMPYDAEQFDKFWPLYPEGKQPLEGERYIFIRHCSGIKLAPSSIFIHADKNILTRRVRDMSDLRYSVDELQDRWFKGQDKPPSRSKLEDSLRKKMGAAFSKEKRLIVPYSYRPFTTTMAFISESVLQEYARGKNSGTRYRPEIISAFESAGTMGIAVAPATKDIGDQLHRFTTFCWHLPDNDLCSRGNAHIFCNKYPEYKSAKKKWNRTPLNNISSSLNERLLKCKIDVSNDDIVYYVYGILCSEVFLDNFEGALFRVAGAATRPRIPIASKAKLFFSIADCGKILAELERDVTGLKLNEKYTKLEKIFDAAFYLDSFKIDIQAGKIELKSQAGRILLIRPIAKEILNFTVSGYNVIQQWLKIHSYPYFRAEFNRDIFKQLLSLMQCIEKQSETISVLDSHVQKLLKEGAFIT